MARRCEQSALEEVAAALGVSMDELRHWLGLWALDQKGADELCESLAEWCERRGVERERVRQNWVDDDREDGCFRIVAAIRGVGEV